MAAVGRIEGVGKRLDLAQQAQRGPLHLDDLRRLLRGGSDGGVARHAGQHAHLAELLTGRKLTDFQRLAVRRVDKNVGARVDDDVKRIAAPVAGADDRLARLVGQQAHVRPDLLAIVIAPVDRDFQIKLVLKVAVVHGQ